MADNTYAATVVRVVDGDTVHLSLTKEFTFPVDFGFGILDTVILRKTANLDFRMFGINTPETHGPAATTGGQMAAGLKSMAELTRLLGLGPLRVVTGKADKYGRWLATIYVQPAKGPELCVNDEMVKGGFAKPYTGEGPKPVLPALKGRSKTFDRLGMEPPTRSTLGDVRGCRVPGLEAEVSEVPVRGEGRMRAGSSDEDDLSVVKEDATGEGSLPGVGLPSLLVLDRDVHGA